MSQKEINQGKAVIPTLETINFKEACSQEEREARTNIKKHARKVCSSGENTIDAIVNFLDGFATVREVK